MSLKDFVSKFLKGNEELMDDLQNQEEQDKKSREAKLTFKPEDFNYTADDMRCTPINAASIAQAKFDEWLKDQPQCYGSPFKSDNDIPVQWDSRPPLPFQTHKARIICIEEIEEDDRQA